MDDALFERGDELAHLHKLVADARAGVSHVALIEGPSGIGKTALMQVLADGERDSGVLIVRARCDEMEKGFAFGAVRQLFEQPLAAAEPEERADLFRGAAHLAAPVLADDAVGAAPQQQSQVTFPVLHGLYWLTVNLAARTPLLILVDDVQWLDPPSARWVHYLVRRLEGLPIALVVTARTDQQTGLQELVDGIARDPLCVRLRPAALSRESVARLIEDTFGQPPESIFSDACHQAAEGNPLLTRELLRALREQGAEPVDAQSERVTEFGWQVMAQEVTRRLRGQRPEVVRLAESLAVLGDGALLDTAAELAGVENQVAKEAVEVLVQLGVVDSAVGPRFTHASIREAVYANLGRARQAAVHHRAARVLTSNLAPVGQIAGHLMNTTPAGDGSAVTTLRRAALEATDKSASDIAAAYLSRALNEPPSEQDRPAVLMELGACETRAGLPGATRHLTEAMTLMPDPRARARVAALLADELQLENRPLDAVEVLEQAIADLPAAERDLRLRLEAPLVMLTQSHISTAGIAARRVSRLKDDTYGSSGDERCLLAVLAASMAFDPRTSTAERAVELAEAALAGSVLRCDATMLVLQRAISAFKHAERLDSAMRWLDRSIEAAQRCGSYRLYAWTSCQRSDANYRIGAIPEALADAQAALEAGGSEQWAWMFPLPVAFHINALLEVGDLERAEQLTRTTFIPEAQESWHWSFFLESRARVHTAVGDPRSALTDLLQCGERQKEWGITNPALVHWRSAAALAHAALGQDDEARRLIDEDLELARMWGTPGALGASLRAAGLLAGGRRGRTLLAEAVQTLEDSSARLEHAHALTDLGVALHRADDNPGARPILRQGIDLAHRCGASALVARAHAALLAAGGRPRRLTITGVDALTPSERRIATLAARGRTNREIAEALFLTQRTVEIHLGRTYRKLTISGRSQLRTAMPASETADEPEGPVDRTPTAGRSGAAR